MTPIPEVFPFAGLDDAWNYPAWVRGLRKSNGVYVFRERHSGEIVYVGESHSDRLYSTLTRHFQAWTDKYETAGITYTRDEVDVAVIVVTAEHAVHLQNELICTLLPRDNRLQCRHIFGLDIDGNPPAEADGDETEEADADDEIDYEFEMRAPPADYDYDISLLLEGIAYEFDEETAQTDDYVPF